MNNCRPLLLSRSPKQIISSMDSSNVRILKRLKKIIVTFLIVYANTFNYNIDLQSKQTLYLWLYVNNGCRFKNLRNKEVLIL